MIITLNPDELRQWNAGVSGWPTCQHCDGVGTVRDNYLHVTRGQMTIENLCRICDGFGRIKQPVYIVIEGEVRDRWPDPIDDACEIRADCPNCVMRGFLPYEENDCGQGNIEYLTCPRCKGDGSVVMAYNAIVEVVPAKGLLLEIALTLDDPLPVPGRHFVAVVTP